MKRIVTLLLSLIMVFSLAACRDKPSSDSSSENSPISSEYVDDSSSEQSSSDGSNDSSSISSERVDDTPSQEPSSQSSDGDVAIAGGTTGAQSTPLKEKAN